MKFVKKITPLLLVFLLTFSAVSCTNRKHETNTVTSVSEVTLSKTEFCTNKETEEAAETIKESAEEKYKVEKETTNELTSETSSSLQKESSITREYTQEIINIAENSISETSTELSSSITHKPEKVRIIINCKHAVEYGTSAISQNGIILDTQVDYHNGDSAMDVLKRALSSTDISLDESRGYIREIGGLKEKDCGSSSGWMYMVNSESPMTSSDKYAVVSGDTVTFYYVTNYGETV